ncbi:hypothetical protein C8R43DRAFT_1131646 [Mycena crocata]|nr:hypothetical protein C8R43DRAFT_1131646 [Mycena crocata]
MGNGDTNTVKREEGFDLGYPDDALMSTATAMCACPCPGTATGYEGHMDMDLGYPNSWQEYSNSKCILSSSSIVHFETPGRPVYQCSEHSYFTQKTRCNSFSFSYNGGFKTTSASGSLTSPSASASTSANANSTYFSRDSHQITSSRNLPPRRRGPRGSALDRDLGSPRSETRTSKTERATELDKSESPTGHLSSARSTAALRAESGDWMNIETSGADPPALRCARVDRTSGRKRHGTARGLLLCISARSRQRLHTTRQTAGTWGKFDRQEIPDSTLCRLDLEREQAPSKRRVRAATRLSPTTTTPVPTQLTIAPKPRGTHGQLTRWLLLFLQDSGLVEASRKRLIVCPRTSGMSTCGTALIVVRTLRDPGVQTTGASATCALALASQVPTRQNSIPRGISVQDVPQVHRNSFPLHRLPLHRLGTTREVDPFTSAVPASDWVSPHSLHTTDAFQNGHTTPNTTLNTTQVARAYVLAEIQAEYHHGGRLGAEGQRILHRIAAHGLCASHSTICGPYASVPDLYQTGALSRSTGVDSTSTRCSTLARGVPTLRQDESRIRGIFGGAEYAVPLTLSLARELDADTPFRKSDHFCRKKAAGESGDLSDTEVRANSPDSHVSQACFLSLRSLTLCPLPCLPLSSPAEPNYERRPVDVVPGLYHNTEHGSRGFRAELLPPSRSLMDTATSRLRQRERYQLVLRVETTENWRIRRARCGDLGGLAEKADWARVASGAWGAFGGFHRHQERKPTQRTNSCAKPNAIPAGTLRGFHGGATIALTQTPRMDPHLARKRPTAMHVARCLIHPPRPARPASKPGQTRIRMEQQVYRIWTYRHIGVLSAFEESSAACISDMLRQRPIPQRHPNVMYVFRSLAPENAGESPFSTGASSSGTYQRWHSHPPSTESPAPCPCNESSHRDMQAPRLGTALRLRTVASVGC